MRFDNEALFNELVGRHGLNLFLGAGFSVYSYNQDEEKLPLGNEINQRLIKLFSLENRKNLNLSKTCQKIRINNEGMLEKILRETYTVKSYDDEYLSIANLPIKNIVTINIDNLIEKVYDASDSKSTLSDTKIYGTLEKNGVVNLYKLHGSVTYPIDYKLSFTEKELTDLFIRDKNLFEVVSYKLSSAPTIFWGTSLYDSNSMELICNSESYSRSKIPKWIVVYPEESNKDFIEDFQDLGFNIIEADTKDLINYLNRQSYAKCSTVSKQIYSIYRKSFPNNFVCNELRKAGVHRPILDFFAGSEPQIPDIMSNNIIQISYFSTAIDKILSGNITLITGIPGCGKST